MIGDRRAQPVSEFLANPLPGPLTLGAADNDRSFGVQDVAPLGLAPRYGAGVWVRLNDALERVDPALRPLVEG